MGEQNGKEIVVGTFNLYQYAEYPYYWYEKKNWNRYGSEEEWGWKQEWIRCQLDEMKADIVAFQEVFSIKSLKALLAKEDKYPYFHAFDDVELQDGVFDNPVVALASKYPFTVEDVDLGLLPDDDLFHEFHFERRPIKARVDVDGMEILVYAVHLKSKSVQNNDARFDSIQEWPDKIYAAMQFRSSENIKAMIQRGREASALYHIVMTDMHMNHNMPVVVLGDCNDDQFSVPIRSLGNSDTLKDINDAYVPGDFKKNRYAYKLYDAFDIFPNQGTPGRKPTYYYHGDGSVLDYVFVSNGLNINNRHEKVGLVTEVKVHDKHLFCGGSKDKEKSDHAQVTATILLNPK